MLSYDVSKVVLTKLKMILALNIVVNVIVIANNTSHDI